MWKKSAGNFSSAKKREEIRSKCSFHLRDNSNVLMEPNAQWSLLISLNKHTDASLFPSTLCIFIHFQFPFIFGTPCSFVHLIFDISVA